MDFNIDCVKVTVCSPHIDELDQRSNTDALEKQNTVRPYDLFYLVQPFLNALKALTWRNTVKRMMAMVAVMKSGLRLIVSGKVKAKAKEMAPRRPP